MAGEMDRQDILRQKLNVLRTEHRDLDVAIQAIEDSVRPDQLTLQRLKRKKLAMKDEIRRLEDEITPDIIA